MDSVSFSPSSWFRALFTTSNQNGTHLKPIRFEIYSKVRCHWKWKSFNRIYFLCCSDSCSLNAQAACLLNRCVFSILFHSNFCIVFLFLRFFPKLKFQLFAMDIFVICFNWNEKNKVECPVFFWECFYHNGCFMHR